MLETTNSLFIEKLHLKNFKGFETAEFQFNARCTIIIGNNAKGKTSILDALAIAAGSFLLGIDGADSKHIGKEQIRTIFRDGLLPQLPVKISAEGSLGTRDYLTWNRQLTKISGRTTSKESSQVAKLAEGMHASKRAEQEVVFPVIAYHGTGRLWAEHQEKIDYKSPGEGVLMGYKDCLSIKSSSKAFLSWYKTFFADARNLKDSTSLVLLETFNETIAKVVPEWTDISFHYGSDDLIGLFKDQNGNDARMPFSNLSDGYRNMIGMIADIAYRCIQLNGTLGARAIVDSPGIILIDELDLHLHPKWQREIVGRLKECFPKIQFVCTTHSPFIVQSLSSEEVLNLDEFGDTIDPFKMSIEEVAVNTMGMEGLKRSEKFDSMKELAEAYFNLVDNGATLDNSAELRDLQVQLEEYLEKEGSDPGLSAMLKIDNNNSSGPNATA